MLYGAVPEQIVTSICAQVDAGERWRPSAPWWMAPTFGEAPDGFVPAGATPLEDLLAKLAAVTYVVDAGTKQEQAVVFRNVADMGTVSDGPLVTVNSLTLGPMRPLPVGMHTVQVRWTFRAMHCDGLGAAVEENCLPAGESELNTVRFEVTPAHE